MPTLRFPAWPGGTEATLTAIGGTGTPANPYTLTQVSGKVHEITIADTLTGKFYLAVANDLAEMVVELDGTDRDYTVDDEDEILAAIDAIDCTGDGSGGGGGSTVIVSPSTTDALQNIRNNILARIQEITAAPKPNYNIDGQQVSWQSYLDSLMANLRRIDDQIALTQDPFEIVSRGIT